MAVKNFNKDSADNFFVKQPSGIVIVTEDDKKVLSIPGNVGHHVDSQKIAVAPGKKYQISLTASITGEETVEKNERIVQMMRMNWFIHSSKYIVLFFDASDKQIGLFSTFIATSKLYDYVNVFYAPPAAKYAVLRIEPKNKDVFISKVKFGLANEENVINCNPDFRYGSLNYCGWFPNRGGQIHKRPDGKYVFESGYGGRGPRFPLKAKTKYRIVFQSIPQNKYPRVVLHFYDKNKKSLGDKRILTGLNGEAGVLEFITPPEVCSANVSLYGVIVEQFKVTQF
jgi:hypothetical protein